MAITRAKATATEQDKDKSNMNEFIENCNKNFKNLDKKLNTIQENNTKIQEDLNKMKDEIIKNLMDSNKNLQNKVHKLEKKIEKLQENQKKINVSVESNNQYGRRNNLEISGIPNDVSDEDLESKVQDIFNKIDIKIKTREIEACHRLPPTRNNPNKKTIIRLVNRKKIEKCLKDKKKLANVNMEELGFAPETKLFASENLNNHFRELCWLCRRLKREGLIYNFKYQNEMILITIKENSEKKLKISHKDELVYYFYDFFYPDGPEAEEEEEE